MTLLPPIEDSYVVPGTRLAAGAYPGSPECVSPAEHDAKLEAFLDAGITSFIDLTAAADRLTPYAERIQALAVARGVAIVHDRPSIRDMDVCGSSHMERVLDTIDARLAEGRGVYVHCWGGVGRTGMVIGCWLVRHGHTGDGALATVAELFASMSPSKVARHPWGSPQTDPQRTMVRDWASVGRRARL